MKTQWETRCSVSWKMNEFIDSAFTVLKQKLETAQQAAIDKALNGKNA